MATLAVASADSSQHRSRLRRQGPTRKLIERAVAEGGVVSKRVGHARRWVAAHEPREASHDSDERVQLL